MCHFNLSVIVDDRASIFNFGNWMFQTGISVNGWNDKFFFIKNK